MPWKGSVRLKRPRLRMCVAPLASRSKLTPLSEGGGAIELEVLAAIKMALLVEVIVS